jgi:hypothetical protein
MTRRKPHPDQLPLLDANVVAPPPRIETDDELWMTVYGSPLWPQLTSETFDNSDGSI